MTETASSASQKRDITKLQRIVVEALEDVKASDLQVFNTEHLSSLFDRVVLASGTSNRQTRALASSVRDKVREAGYPKPRLEGEDNGEWIVVDCGSVVAHVMQPAIRQYYHLEDIWGEKPVRVKPVAAEKAEQKRQKSADGASKPATEASNRKATVKKALAAPVQSAATRPPVKKAGGTAKVVSARGLGVPAASAPIKAAASPTLKAAATKKAATSKDVTATQGLAPKASAARVKATATKKVAAKTVGTKAAVAKKVFVKKSLGKSAGATPKA